MKHITLILTIIALLACTNHKAQNTNSEPQDTIQSQQSSDFRLQTSDNNEKTDKDSLLIPKEILLGKFNPAQDTNFILIPEHMASNKSMYCHRETFQAYLAMRDSALRDGITLTIVSATRNFDRQKQIWDRKWQNTQCPQNCPSKLGGRTQRAEGGCNTDSLQLACDIYKVRSIMRYSSMPGTSRHHWGTDLDFISVEPEDWTHGEGLRIYNWLCANAHKFGFFQPYTADPTRTGYAEERWHWSYAPLSKPYLEAYRQKITAEDITGFSGSYLVDSLGIIQSHVFGITE
ncbi:MAG: M15 family metallopeptidase [Paludibacteraceae bacterium]|nr:M15 family metallopeptidase [Paludibacteraceae bacterium]